MIIITTIKSSEFEDSQSKDLVVEKLRERSSSYRFCVSSYGHAFMEERRYFPDVRSFTYGSCPGKPVRERAIRLASLQATSGTEERRARCFCRSASFQINNTDRGGFSVIRKIGGPSLKPNTWKLLLLPAFFSHLLEMERPLPIENGAAIFTRYLQASLYSSESPFFPRQFILTLSKANSSFPFSQFVTSLVSISVRDVWRNFHDEVGQRFDWISFKLDEHAFIQLLLKLSRVIFIAVQKHGGKRSRLL